jgi:ATP-binding protein involved in chromosome partitioning
MTEITENQVKAALVTYIQPHLQCDLISAKAVQKILISQDQIALTVVLGFPALSVHADIVAGLQAAVQQAFPTVRQCTVDIQTRVVAHAVQTGLQPLPQVKNVIAVASGKGGVGKSTTAVNLALALAAEGAQVGILDADIYGPSQPRMLGIAGRPESEDGKRLEPMRSYHLQAMSIGFLVEEDTPMIWRGPMVTQMLQQLVNETNWSGLDYLIVDLPPGTGDTQLTLAQKVPVAGAVIVTTPQDIALLDARKGLRMFEKVSVPVLGIVENMSTHICSQCQHEEPIFGTGGGERIAEQYGVPLLGALPLQLRIREQMDDGKPTVVAEPDGLVAQTYRRIARKLAAALSLQKRDYAAKFPKIAVQ